MSAIKQGFDCLTCHDRGYQWTALSDGEPIKEPCPDCFDRLCQEAQDGTPVGQSFRQAHGAAWYRAFESYAGHPLTPRQRVTFEAFLAFADKLATVFRLDTSAPRPGGLA